MEKLEKLQIVLAGLVLALGLILAVNAGTANLSNDKITVTGSAFRNVESDSARLEFEINERKADKQQAYNAVKNKLPIVQKYLKDQGITDIEIKASNGYNSYKYTANGNMTNDIAYYNLSQPIVIKSNDVGKIKYISSDIQSLLEKDVDINIISTEYFYSKLGDLKVELLEDATKMQKKEQMLC